MSILSTTLGQLDVLLTSWKFLWQCRPFEYFDIPWRDEMPPLAAWLDTLSLSEIQTYDTHPEQLSDVLSAYVPDAPLLSELSHLPRYPILREHFEEKLRYRIPGRKWQQITTFAGSIPFDGTPILEWCSGKGHLGRLLACAYGTQVNSLEIDAALCLKGETLARRAHAPMHFHEVDVLSSSATTHLHSNQHAVALHACGELHLKLLKEASHAQCQSISIAPCCYHLIPSKFYNPLSSVGQKSRLKLSRFDSKLPLQETVTANSRIHRLRQRELSWRLAFDLLQRDVTGNPHYITLPTVKDSLLSQDFPAFCRWATTKHKIVLPNKIDYEKYEEKAIDRRLQIARIELVRHLFRRPLEVWLLLDRALFLEEQGYHVTVGVFCDKPITPRNILIHAVR